MPVPTSTPPDSYYMQIVKRLATILMADDDLVDYFGWVPDGVDDDNPLRRRIFFDDNGDVDAAVSPKLCITEYAQLDDFTVLGDGGAVDSDIAAHLAIVVYVALPKGSKGENEKILVGNLHNAVRQVIRSNPVERSDGLWSDLKFVGVSASFDQSEGFRRAGGVLGLYASARITE